MIRRPDPEMTPDNITTDRNPGPRTPHTPWHAALFAATLLIPAAGAAAAPVDMVASPAGDRLYVAMRDGSAIASVDPEAGKVLRVMRLEHKPTGLALSPDGSKLHVTSGLGKGRWTELETSSGRVLRELAVGHSPMAPVASRDGTRLYLCNRFENSVEVINLDTGKKAASHAVTREPVAAVMRPDGKALFVANHLPAGAADGGYISAAVTVIDTASGATHRIALPNGSTGLRGAACSPDGAFVYLTHTLARYGLPTTQLDRGWMNTSAVSVIDARKFEYLATVLLDEIDRGAANPWGAACSPDGMILAIAHEGTHEVSLIDRAGMHNRIARAANGEKVTEVSSSLDSIQNDLAFLNGIRRRVAIDGSGPRAVAIAGRLAGAACHFSDSLSLVDLASDPRSVKVRRVPLANTGKPSLVRRGEILFHDATTCFQHWQSCATCHPDGRSDALNWDLLNDGIGNPKQTKSMLFSIQTPPAMISGIRSTGQAAVRAGMKHIQFAVRPEEEAVAIDAYLENLEPVPSPALVDGKLSPAAARGKAVFEKAGCAVCHNGPHFTDKRSHDVGTGRGREKAVKWDTPTLREVWRTAPYLYDGRAPTLEAVFTEHNPGDRHGKTSHLSKDELHHLVEFVRSL